MDLVELIKQKIASFEGSEYLESLRSVIEHINVAIRHFETAKGTGEDYLFNDAVYRTNQAFEGALKETYFLFTGNIDKNMTPFKIEKYLEKNDLLKDRVLNLFKNYRQGWRNPSTHDYKLIISEQEAFLAIVSISSFYIVLLDQMIERHYFNLERLKIEQQNIELPEKYAKKDFEDKVVTLLTNASHEIDIHSVARGSTVLWHVESEILGLISGYIQGLDPSLKVNTGHRIVTADGKKLELDLLIQEDDNQIVVEIKHGNTRGKKIKSLGREQLLRYLVFASLSVGILYIAPSTPGQKMINEVEVTQIGGEAYKIIYIMPDHDA